MELLKQLHVQLVKDWSELAATVLQHYASQQSTPATLAPSPPLTEKSVSWIERIQFRWTQQQWQNLVNLNRTILFFGVEFKNLSGHTLNIKHEQKWKINCVHLVSIQFLTCMEALFGHVMRDVVILSYPFGPDLAKKNSHFWSPGCLDRCLDLAKIAPRYILPSIGMWYGTLGPS